MNTLPHFILASTSSIRKKILDNAGLSYECVKPLVEEPRAIGFESASDYVKHCARIKAQSVSDKHPTEIVIGCDQTVFFEGKILNKALDLEDCKKRLFRFSSKAHQLINGLSFYRQGKEIKYHEESVTITMRSLTESMIHLYVEKEKPLSSVACYFLEGEGIQLIRSIDGNYFSALGLPLLRVIDFLETQNEQDSRNTF